MKSFLKVFLISLLTFTAIITSGFVAFQKLYSSSYEEIELSSEGDINSSVDGTEKAIKITDDMTDIEKAYYSSGKINILFVGLEDTRTDAMILGIFDFKKKKIDMVSIPRDTYYNPYNFSSPGKKKINAAYGYGSGKGGIQGSAKAVSSILGVPVAKYVKIEYDGVKKVADALGGVQVDIPFDMNYDDKYSKPPLHIHFKKGPKLLKGDDAIRFLRWRKNNKGVPLKYSDGGDIGRIQRQHQFIESALKKAIGPKLPQFLMATFDSIKTNVKFDDASDYAQQLVGLQKNAIHSYTVPGEAKTIDSVSYFLHDKKDTKKLIEAIYSEDDETLREFRVEK